MEVYWGYESIAPRILDLGTRWRLVSFTTRPLYPQGKSSCYPLDRRLGGPQSRSGHGGEEKNPQPLPELEPLIIQPVAQRYTTELNRLLQIHILFNNVIILFDVHKRRETTGPKDKFLHLRNLPSLVLINEITSL
jgi:hypothetical protein